MTAPSRHDRQHPISERIDQRNEFQRDRDRILYSEAFRRLQGVTQVVSADEGWVVHNRLTHSLKVAQVAKRIAERILDEDPDPTLLENLGGLDPEVCEAAGLAHDLGHPPFGHVAEEALQLLTEDSGHFEGNAQSFRILTKIEPHSSSYRGLNLTRATLAAVTKYPMARTRSGGPPNPKYGYYSQSEADEFTFAHALFEPGDRFKSLEAEIMDFADDITFAIHDTEDFYRAGLIPLNELGSDLDSVLTPEALRLKEDIDRRWRKRPCPAFFEDKHLDALKMVLDPLRMSSSYSGLQQERIDIKKAASYLISDWIQRGINLNPDYKQGQRRVVFDSGISLQIKMLKELVWTYVIDRPSLALQQAGYRRIVKVLFYFFLKNLKRGELRAIPLQFHGLIADRDMGKESNHRIAADIICSLTDNQALILYRRITGSDPGGILRAAI